MVVTREVSHRETSMLKLVDDLNARYMVVTLEVSHCEISLLNEFANALLYQEPEEDEAHSRVEKLVKLDVSHSEISPLKEVA